MKRTLAFGVLVFAVPAHTATIDWVHIGNPGNPADTRLCAGTNCGSVAYDYFISKYEVTNGQYVEFLEHQFWWADRIRQGRTALSHRR